MASNCRSFEFTAIRGFHIYQKVWQPELNDTLVCIHERGNKFDAFSVKTVRADDNTIVGHLPREISRPTKVFTWQGSDSKSYNYMFVLPSLSTFSRWPRDTMYGYSEYVRNNSKSFVIRSVQRTCQWPILWAWRWSYHRNFSIANWTSSNWEATKTKRKRFGATTSGFCLNARKKTTRIKIKAKKQTRQLLLIKYTVYRFGWKKSIWTWFIRCTLLFVLKNVSLVNLMIKNRQKYDFLQI